tara:strand:- start:177 stop:1100 length:924 start_codon:yes stop_codon:yes gene_type:complete
MKKIKLLIIGYSKFVEKRLVSSLKKIKKIDYRICSKTKIKDNIHYDDYLEGLKFSPDLIYISLTNHLHFKFAKLFLKKGYNVIVDKPITESLIKTRELIKIAKSKRLLLSEATLFNYHSVFQQITKIIGGKKKIEFLQSYFNIPQVKSLREINLTKSDCFMDMSPYAAALIRLYLNKKNLSMNFDFKKFSKNKNIKSFYVLANDKKIRYFGNFSFDNEYLSQIVFFSKKKIIYLPNQAFALPSSKKIKITIKENNRFKFFTFKKDDCIYNYLAEVLMALKNKKYDSFYNKMIQDSQIRENLLKKIKK